MVRPRQHFRFAGKYLRAVERALLVTSTIDAFPVVINPEETADASSSPFMSIGSLREATTPLFSPIPFLHEDARRRSRSRSPPMSPLNLSTNAPARPLSPSADPLSLGPAAVDSGAAAAAVTPVIGLVDELDDPGPGHLSDHPTALTSTTTTVPTATDAPTNAPSGTQAGATTVPKPMFGGSLQDRFVKSSSDTAEADMEATPSSSSGDQVPSASGGAAESRSAPSSGAEAVSNAGDNSNNMVVDETEADKENVPKSSS